MTMNWSISYLWCGLPAYTTQLFSRWQSTHHHEFKLSSIFECIFIYFEYILHNFLYILTVFIYSYSFLGLPALIHAIIVRLLKSIWWYRSTLHLQRKHKAKTHTQKMENSSKKCFLVILHRIAIKSIKCSDEQTQLWIILWSCIKGCSVYNPFRNALWPELACAKFLHQSWHSALPR